MSLLQREYLSSAVNVSTNSPKTFDLTNTDFFEPRLSQSDQKMEKLLSRKFPQCLGPFNIVAI